MFLIQKNRQKCLYDILAFKILGIEMSHKEIDPINVAFLVKKVYILEEEIKKINKNLNNLWEELSDLKDEQEALSENYSKHIGEY